MAVVDEVMGDQPHRSIGEVLALVQEEFPDVTISKIRFLESQGLLDPERTPSGYRKFYPADVERLQWILTQQRDNFLPLKVIRERLDEWDATGTAPESASAPPPSPPAQEARVSTDPDDDMRHAAASLAAASAQEVVADQAAAPTPDPELDSEGGDDTEAVDEVEPAAETAGGAELQVGPGDSALTAGELAKLAGVTEAVVKELESFSLIDSHRVGPEDYYDPKYTPVVQAARVFLEHGIEVRHLRMYKIAAEREAGVFEQLVMPLLKQRNPDARARAVSLVESLAEVGEDLHRALLRQVLERTLP